MSQRAFVTAVEHDTTIIDSINSLVDVRDYLVMAGDFCKKGAKSFLDRIRCKNVRLVVGNHDAGSDIKAFWCASDIYETKIRDMHIVVSHYPMAYWNKSHRLSGHLYGHTHQQREESLDAVFPGRRSMDIGLDNAKALLGAYVPFSETQIYDLLSAKPGHDPIEYYSHRRAARGEQQPNHMGDFNA